ncbi:MAG: hypothetical protein ACLS7Z_09485 [Christensenellales bacterium]
MNTQPKQKISVQTLTQLAILVAIEVVMKLIGLGSVPVGPLYMSFLTVPIAIGAIVIGPMASMLLGGIFGFVSFMDAIRRVDHDLDAAGRVRGAYVHPVLWHAVADGPVRGNRVSRDD